MLDRVLAARPRLAPRLDHLHSRCATDIECKAVEQAVRAAGARYTTYVPASRGSRLWAQVSTSRPEQRSCSSTSAAEQRKSPCWDPAASFFCARFKIGGDAFDDAIRQRLALDRFLIGQLTAEHLKIASEYVGRPRGCPPMRIAGADLHAGAPRSREVSESMVGEAMKESVEGILPCRVVRYSNHPHRTRRRISSIAALY